MTNILITGAGRGIGLELARQAAGAGLQVYGSVRDEAAVARLERELPGVRPLVFDVADADQVSRAAAGFDGPLDILVNNAGVIGPKVQSTFEMDFEGFAETLNINTLAPLRVTQAFLPALRKADCAKIVMISSNMGRMVADKSDRIAYRASKAALNRITMALADDLRAEEICCVATHPGWVRTDMGGGAADIDAAESAAGLLSLIQGLKMKDSGTFIDWDGTRQSW